MNVNVNDLMITSLETITAFDIVTGDYLFTLDELQNAQISQSQDQTDITGKQGRRLSSLKRNKQVTLTGTNGVLSGGLMELQTGSAFDSKETTVLWTDYLTVADNAATTSFIAVGTAGNEIDKIYVKNADGTLGKVLTQSSTAGASGQFAYDVTTKGLTFYAGDLENGTEIAVYYMRKIKASVLENPSDKYSGKSALYVDAFAEDKCANIYRVQFYIPKADFNGNFDIALGDDQTVHAFEAFAEAGACGTGGNFFTYTVFGAEEGDVTE